jgi:hypothetical protein
MSNEDSQWGPWISHDGSGCPCKGSWVEVLYDKPNKIWRGIATGGPSWDWEYGWWRIFTYRIRKPKGLVILEKLLQDLPTKVDPVAA